MRASTFFTTLATASLATARIVGIAAPSTLAPNTTFSLTLLSENYIQTVADVAVAWGYSIAPGYSGALGQYSSNAYLGPDQSNQGQKNITIDATVPEELSQAYYSGKQILLSAAVYSLYGASGTATLSSWNVSISVGDETSDDMVSSTESVAL